MSETPMARMDRLLLKWKGYFIYYRPHFTGYENTAGCRVIGYTIHLKGGRVHLVDFVYEGTEVKPPDNIARGGIYFNDIGSGVYIGVDETIDEFEFV